MSESWSVLIGAFFIVLLVRIPRVLSLKSYFPVSDLVFPMSGTLTPTSVIIRMIKPMFVGFILALFVSENQESVATVAGILGACFLIAPVVLNPRSLPPHLYNRRVYLFTIYGMFVISFAVLGNIGALLGKLFQSALILTFASSTVDVRQITLSQIWDVTKSALGELAGAGILYLLTERYIRKVK